MPREPRIYTENVLYFITAKGDEDRNLFNDAEDYREYLSSLKEYKKEYGFKLYAYCLLPKNLCLLIELKNNVTISTIMHNLNTKYTKFYNSRYGKKGHLFQSRFKSKLIEKDDYLLRLTRYIHLLPRETALVEDAASYAFSSLGLYGQTGSAGSSVHPDMTLEINEVLGCFQDVKSANDQSGAYVRYVLLAGKQECDDVQRLLHRRAFIGSGDFVRTMERKVEEHVREEEEARVVRKPNMAFLTVGSLVIIFLSIAAYSFYSYQANLQNTLEVATTGMGAARDDLAKRVNSLQSELVMYEEKENNGLGGFAWELKLIPVQEDSAGQAYTDRLQFKGGQVVSKMLLAKGFTPFEYTIQDQTHGQKIWQTSQTNPDGTTVRWYGIISGDQMRGVLTEIPAQGQSRDFSFMSVRRVNESGRMNNVVQ